MPLWNGGGIDIDRVLGELYVRRMLAFLGLSAEATVRVTERAVTVTIRWPHRKTAFEKIFLGMTDESKMAKFKVSPPRVRTKMRNWQNCAVRADRILKTLENVPETIRNSSVVRGAVLKAGRRHCK